MAGKTEWMPPPCAPNQPERPTVTPLARNPRRTSNDNRLASLRKPQPLHILSTRSLQGSAEHSGLFQAHACTHTYATHHVEDLKRGEVENIEMTPHPFFSSSNYCSPVCLNPRHSGKYKSIITQVFSIYGGIPEICCYAWPLHSSHDRIVFYNIPEQGQGASRSVQTSAQLLKCLIRPKADHPYMRGT